MTNCNRCNAEMVLNPRTNKMFCKDKCWLNNGQPSKVSPSPLNNAEPVNAPIVKPGEQTVGRDQLIIRQCALKAAVELAKSIDKLDVLGIATDFESWILR